MVNSAGIGGFRLSLWYCRNLSWYTRQSFVLAELASGGAFVFLALRTRSVGNLDARCTNNLPSTSDPDMLDMGEDFCSLRPRFVGLSQSFPQGNVAEIPGDSSSN
jgi:hypothetical protein